MEVAVARAVLGLQHKNLRKLKDARFGYKGYEYRVNYQGGYSAFVAIDYRQAGKRNFKPFGGFGAYDCATAQEAYIRAIDIVMEREKGHNK